MSGTLRDGDLDRQRGVQDRAEAAPRKQRLRAGRAWRIAFAGRGSEDRGGRPRRGAQLLAFLLVAAALGVLALPFVLSGSAPRPVASGSPVAAVTDGANLDGSSSDATAGLGSNPDDASAAATAAGPDSSTGDDPASTNAETPPATESAPSGSATPGSSDTDTDNDPTAHESPGDAPDDPADPDWWRSITVRAKDHAYSGDQVVWVEVTTPKPTQCILHVYFNPQMEADYGGFDRPSSEPRWRTISVPEDFSGTAYIKVWCWRDGLSGPTHLWTLPLVVTSGPHPSATPPSWTISAHAVSARAGASAKLVFTVGTRGMCYASYVLDSGDGVSGSGPAYVKPGQQFTLPMEILPDEAPQGGRWTLTCRDLDGNEKSVSGTFQVLPPASTPPPSDDTVPTEEPPTEPPAPTPHPSPTATPRPTPSPTPARTSAAPATTGPAATP